MIIWLTNSLANNSMFSIGQGQQITLDWNMDSLLSGQKEIVLQIMFTLKIVLNGMGKHNFFLFD